ncbi:MULTISPECIES: hypothetical protein [unclassified Sulfuricurvum]|uniref:hypothetical protein n=1 Tax=unclassified Sulfuricurvum TaxID=2632390 RepID=UPI00029970DE|nr:MULTISPECIES: hypothetical protein [unclassified Sulfuricurvum]AFV97316.1 hypothetical protein B649_05010 [Candidatus Sulfuricurvum sp. RIFRC-1]
MSLKENMDALKEELSSEEKFFESAVRTERFVKRYQKPLIAAVAASLLAVSGAIGYQAYSNAKIESSNAAFNVLLTNPSDATAEQTLKNDNPALYDVWKLSRGIAQNDVTILEGLKNSQAFGVADIALYEAAAIKNDTASLEQYTKKQGALYKDLALLEVAVASIEKGDIAAAHQKIAQISEESPMYQVASALSHYGVK